MYYGSNNCYVRAFDASTRSRSGELCEDTSLASSIVNTRRSILSKHDNSDGEILLLNEQAQAMGSIPQFIQNDQHNTDDIDLSPVISIEQYVEGGIAIEYNEYNEENCAGKINDMVMIPALNIDQRR